MIVETPPSQQWGTVNSRLPSHWRQPFLWILFGKRMGGMGWQLSTTTFNEIEDPSDVHSAVDTWGDLPSLQSALFSVTTAKYSGAFSIFNSSSIRIWLCSCPLFWPIVSNYRMKAKSRTCESQRGTAMHSYLANRYPWSPNAPESLPSGIQIPAVYRCRIPPFLGTLILVENVPWLLLNSLANKH